MFFIILLKSRGVGCEKMWVANSEKSKFFTTKDTKGIHKGHKGV